MEQALKPEAQGNVAVEPVAVVERLKIIAAHRCSNDLGFDTEIGPLGCALEAQPGGSCFCAQVIPTVREAASSIASLSERLAEVEREFRKIASFVEIHWEGAGLPLRADWIIARVNAWADEREAAEQERDELRAKLAEARAIIEPFADADAGMPTDAGEQDQVMFVCQMKDGRQATFAWARPAAFRRARAFRDATSGAKS